MPANPTLPMPAVSCAASRIIGNIASYSPRALPSDVPQPWLNMNRSVTPASTTSVRKSPCAGAVTRPFSSKWRSHTGSPVCSRLMAVALSLDVREHSHQVDQARALREPLPADIGGTAGQQARRVDGSFRRVQPRPGADLAAGRGGYPLTGRHNVRLHPSVERRSLARGPGDSEGARRLAVGGSDRDAVLGV